MALPTSVDWTIFDFDQTSIANFLIQPEVTAVGNTAIVGGLLTIISANGLESSVDVDVSVGQNFSLEFDLYATSLPADLSTLNVSRCFFAVYDQQDNAAGLLISQSGLAWVSTAVGLASISPIPGSAGLVVAGSWYRLRLVVDGQADVMYVYITPRELVATAGHILRYTTAALTTPAGVADACRIECFGPATAITHIGIESLKLSSTLAMPNKVPIAVAGDDIQSLAGRFVALDGRGSYDPDGDPLTVYGWRMLSAPADSRWVSTGMAGHTPAEPDPDVVTDVFEDVVGFAGLDLLAAGDLLTTAGVTATIDLVSFDADGQLINPLSLTMTTACLPEAQTGLYWTIVHQQAVGDVANALTYAEIDAVGVYTFGLTVGDGLLDSLEAQKLVQVVDSHLVRADAADMDYLWSVLGDEWSAVGDRRMITTIWDAYSLAAAGYLSWCWQVWAGRSLATIPATLARKWVPVYTTVDKRRWAGTDYVHLHPPMLTAIVGPTAVVGKRLSFTLRGEVYEVVFVGVDPLPVADIVYQVNAALPLSLATAVADRVVFGADEYFVVNAGGTANAVFGLDVDDDTPDYLQGVDARPRDMPVGAVKSAFTTLLSSLAYAYRAHRQGGAGGVQFHAVDDVVNTLTTTTLPASATLAEVLAFVNTLAVVYNAHDANTGGDYHEAVGGGGGHQVNVAVATSWQAAVDVYNQMTPVFNQHIAHDAGVPVYHQLESDTYYHQSGQADDWQAGEDDLRTVEIADRVDFSGLPLANFLFRADDQVYRIARVLSPTRLLLRQPLPAFGQYSWSIKPMIRFEGLDVGGLRVSTDDRLWFSSTPDGDGQTVVVGSRVDGAIGYHISFDPTVFARHPGGLTVEKLAKWQHLPTFDQVVGIPYLQQGLEDPTVYHQGRDYQVEDVDGQKWVSWTISPPEPPDVWWAEYMLLSNDPTVEANFGWLAGIEADDVDDDYLAVVTALFYSYWRGPVLSAIRLGVQALSGLPIVNVGGQIVDVNTFFSTTLGRILVEEDDDVVTAYYYRRRAEIAVNPATGRVYAQGDQVARFTCLSTGVDVVDYLDDAGWYVHYQQQGLMHEVEKYHQFYVAADIDVVGLSRWPLLIKFLDRAKAARTDYRLVGVKNVETEIDVADTVELTTVLALADDPCTLADGGVRSVDDVDGGGRWRHRHPDFHHGGDDVSTWSMAGLTQTDRIGIGGVGDDRFLRPTGVAVDPVAGGWLVVADSRNHRLVKRLIVDLSYVEEIGSPGTGDDQFNQPADLAVGGVHLWVVDTLNHRLFKRLAADLSYVAKVGALGDGLDGFNCPQGVAADGLYVWVADTGNHRLVKRLAADLSYVDHTDCLATPAGRFNHPRGVAVAGVHVLVADTGNNRIVRLLAADLSYVDSLGVRGQGDGQFDRPEDLAVGPTCVYVADVGNHRVVVLDRLTLAYVDAVGSRGSEVGEFNQPTGIACLAGGVDFYVADVGSDWADDSRLHPGVRDDVWDFTSTACLSAEVPVIESRRLEDIDVTALTGRTLTLAVGDGRHCPDLVAAAGYNLPAAGGMLPLDYARDGGMLAPTAGNNADIDVFDQWAGDGALRLFPGMMMVGNLRYDTVGVVDTMLEKGTISFRLRLPTSSPIPKYLISVGTPMSWVDAVDIYLTAGGPTLDQLHFDLWDSAGAPAFALTAPPAPWLLDTWYEITAVWDLSLDFHAIYVDGTVVAAGIVGGPPPPRTGVGDFLVVGTSLNIGLGESDFLVDNLRLYDRPIYEGDHLPAPVEAYFDPGEVEVTFGAIVVAADVVAAVNELLPRTAHIRQPVAGYTQLVLASWNRQIRVVGGSACELLGLTAGQTSRRVDIFAYKGDVDLSLPVPPGGMGADVNGLTMIVDVEGNQSVITFAGVNPIPAADIVVAINMAIGGVPAGFACLDGAFLKCQHPYFFTLRGHGTANALLGLPRVDVRSLVDLQTALCPDNVFDVIRCEDYGAGDTKEDVVDALNMFVACYEGHRQDGVVHAVADGVNVFPLPPLTYVDTLTTALAFVNTCKAVFNDHDANAGGVFHENPGGPGGDYQVVTGDAISWTSSAALFGDLVIEYLGHIDDNAGVPDVYHLAKDLVNVPAVTTLTVAELTYDSVFRHDDPDNAWTHDTILTGVHCSRRVLT